jgi:hypothetical protein
MYVLYLILFFTGGVCLIVLGIWLTLKELETFSKRHNDKWTIGQIRGMGAACIGIGLVLILQAFN